MTNEFFSDFYHVESSSLIDYGECQRGKELELAEVAVFLLSALVQNLLSSEDKVAYNIILLEQEVQANICECMALVCGEKDMGENQINKSELHKVLSRAASYNGSPNVLETLMLMNRLSIYADEQTSRETLERKEQKQEKETIGERIKRLAHKGETSKNKNPNVESLQAMVDHLRGSVERLEKEKSDLKEKLEYYESNFGSTSDDISVARDLNSIKKESDRIESTTDDVSESSHSTKYDNKMDGQLLASVSDYSQHSRTDSFLNNPVQFAQINLPYDNSILLSIVKQLQRKKCIAPAIAKIMKENCFKIKDRNEFSARLRDLSDALFHAGPFVTTRRSRNFSD
ncbi:hypothetical protein AVEN_226700-1 [Araneus ventricosus]|uniref:Uncharacterized protein n=1 Tax=Araneus ventricosus TaxID=182803 RepID=A0A4Y2CXM4_ARAVE|nr:hypothetical protein AVEN_226700-1 [Araneus ventricosus]